MLVEENRKATIIAYYLSKFDIDAVKSLGYSNTSEAFAELSKIFGKNNHYMKLRRDEFDVLTGSHRKGWRNREPAFVVQTFHNGLKNYTFDELCKIVKLLIADNSDFRISEDKTIELKNEMSKYSEEEIELIINAKDYTSNLFHNQKLCASRIFDNKIQKSLKEIYEYRCQVCGTRAIEIYNVDISEAHHIEYFSLTANNNANNVMILCPDHHRIVHKAKPIFNTASKLFEYSNGRIDELMYNIHL